MNVETRLRDAMADAVAPAIPDTDHLVTLARRRGLGIRRRRQALGAVGVAAALGLAVLAPTVIAGERGRSGPAPMLVGTAPVTFDTRATDPLTGRSTAAALRYAVGLEATGTATDFAGQGFVAGEGSGGPGTQSYGRFAFTPDAGSTAGEVGVNVQSFSRDLAKGEQDTRTRCASSMEECRVTQLPDGSVLRTSVTRSDYGSHSGVMRVADLYRADHVRVVAYASNGYDITERDEKVTGSEPVLTTAQLVAAVEQPWWGLRLPTYFTDQGATLSPYVEIGGAAAASTAPTPDSKG